ncbi:MAG: serine/threonine protein kinase [Candidatus Bathyarchaeota archaeon]|nr:MAG: serine/threonine protein kinase [Candidatus Bathyarchaeota archaeon]
MPHKETIVPLRNLREKKYGQVLCYPRFDLSQIAGRLEELEALGVKALEFSGESGVLDMPVLGKGCVGIVVIAHTNQGKAALKIRRVDADRTEMEHEARMLRRANSVRVGPTLLNVTEDFLLMEFIQGSLLPKWVELACGNDVVGRIRKVLRCILEQCWRLDEEGIDHGELSTAPKHVLVRSNDKPCLVDFETASIDRRVANVTSICHYLFIGSHFSEIIEAKLGKINKADLLKVLRIYKRGSTRKRFESVLDTYGLRKV